jgi:hypothetical protein
MRDLYAKFLLTATLLFASTANANLLESTVTGSLVFADVSIPGGGFETINYFDPSNRFVPVTGYLNSSSEFNSPTVTITNDNIEFGFDNRGGLTDTANFGGATLTITSSATQSATLHSFKYEFTDAAFAGLNILEVADSFLSGGLSASSFNGTITIVGNRADVTPGTLQVATFTLNPASIPEPGSIILVCFGLLGLAASRHKTLRSNVG